MSARAPQAGRWVCLVGLAMVGLASVPSGSAAASSPLTLAPTSATGWADAANALTLGDATYASTASGGSVLSLQAFADAAPRGPVTSVTLRIDLQQVSHQDDTVTVAAASPGCASITPSPAAPAPPSVRTVVAVQLSCAGGWSWAAANGLSATLRADEVGGVLLLSGVDGQWRVYGAWVEVAYTDAPPTADAGADGIVQEGAAAALDGSASSDPEGLPLAYAWTQQGGPAVTLQGASTATPSFTAPALATNQPVALSFRLDVTDADTQSASDTVVLTLQNTNQPPTAHAGPDTAATPGQTVALDGRGSSDPDQDTLAFAWSQDQGPAVALSSPSSPSPTFAAPAGPATLRFSLVVRDALGAASPSDSVTVTVAAATTSPPPASPPPPSPPPPTPAPSTSGTASSGTTSPAPPASPPSTPPPSTSAPPSPTASPTGAVGGSSLPPQPEAELTLQAAVQGPAESAPGSAVPLAPCQATLPPEASGRTVAVELEAACGLRSAVVTLPGGAEAAAFAVRPARADESPPPPGVLVAALRLVVQDGDGQEVEPALATLRFTVDAAWARDNCPPDRCSLRVFHHRGGAWEDLGAQRLPDEGDVAVLEARTASFSLFAVAAVAQEPAPGWAWPLWAGAGAVGLVATGGAAWGVRAARRRRRPREPHPSTTLAVAPRDPASPHDAAPPGTAVAPSASPADGATSGIDARVSRLVQEMRTNQELLQFVNNAAHDLANPLTPINLQLAMLEMGDGAGGDRGKKALGVVQRNVDQLAMLVGDLKDAAKLQAGKLRIVPARLDLAAAVGDVVESYTAQAEAAGIALARDISGPLWVQADKGRLTQVLGNLLNNALKFTPKGGSVTVTAAREMEWGLVLVRDSGLGLSAEDRERLFRPFSQVHGEKEKAKGTGLGLFICKGIVDAHQGRIGCDSQGPGTGATFWFSLPLVEAVEGSPPDFPVKGTPGGAPPPPAEAPPPLAPGASAPRGRRARAGR